MSQEPKPNIMHGIGAYAHPHREIEKRVFVRQYLGRASAKDWVGQRDACVKEFGRETVRAVARSYYEAGDFREATSR